MAAADGGMDQEGFLRPALEAVVDEAREEEEEAEVNGEQSQEGSEIDHRGFPPRAPPEY